MKLASPYCGASTLLPSVKTRAHQERKRRQHDYERQPRAVARHGRPRPSANRVMRWSARPDERRRAMTVSVTGRRPALRPQLEEQACSRALSASYPPTHENFPGRPSSSPRTRGCNWRGWSDRAFARAAPGPVIRVRGRIIAKLPIRHLPFFRHQEIHQQHGGVRMRRLAGDRDTGVGHRHRTGAAQASGAPLSALAATWEL